MADPNALEDILARNFHDHSWLAARNKASWARIVTAAREIEAVLDEVRAEAWEVGRTDGHRELRPINAFGETEAARNPYRGGTP